MPVTLAARGHAELLADGRADRRSGLDDHMLGRVRKSFPYLVRWVVALEGAGGTSIDALPAVDADDVDEIIGHSRHDDRVPAATRRMQRGHALNIVARANASAADDALLGIAQHRRAGEVLLVNPAVAFEADVHDPQLLGQRLEFALLALRARQALLRMVREHQLGDHLAGVADLGRVREDFHPLADGVVARGAQRALALDLDRANPADAVRGEVRMVAQRRYVYPGLLSRRQDSHPSLGLDVLAVDFDVNCCHSYSPFVALSLRARIANPAQQGGGWPNKGVAT